MSELTAAEDEAWLREAMREAERAREAEEVPCGCVIVREGAIIARARNEVETRGDATAHAEMLALRAAQKSLGDWRLTGCTLYVTKEPCPMCAGAIVHCRPDRVVFGIPDPRGGACGGWINLTDANPPLNHRCEVLGGLLGDECLEQFQSFFREARAASKLAKLSARTEQRLAELQDLPGEYPQLELYLHAEGGWVSEPLRAQMQEALRALLPYLLALPKGPEHVLSELGEIELSLIDDASITQVHADFLDDPTPTDVITFPYGEIMVSVDTAARYAQEHGLNASLELFRYCVHGLVHLHGYLDATEAERIALFAVQEPLVARFSSNLAL